MMKKSILSLMAGAIVALASCSQTDEMPGQPQEGEQLATFTIQTPAATRGAVTGLSRYIVEAYEGSSATGTPAARVEDSAGSLTLGLKKNTDYTFLFWADKGTAKARSTASSDYWDTDDLKAVTVTSSKKSDKGEAAYCLVKTFNSKDFAANATVTLKNATAQVNFVESSGLLSANNTLAVTYAAGATLNVGTGKVTEVSGAITHTFTGIGQVSADATLATDYILAPKGEQIVRDLTLKLNTEDPKSVTNVPFEQCFITNIKGEYSSLGQFTFTVEADDTWDGNHDYDLSVWDGKYPADEAEAKQWLGTESEGADNADGKNHVFEISTAKQLCALHVLVSKNVVMDNASTNDKYLHACYKLMTDIDLNNSPWKPIGSGLQGSAFAFIGTFDGQGHTISGLNVSADTWAHAGLFGYLGSTGVIKHLMVEGSVQSTRNTLLGGISGRNVGTIAFCSFEGTVTGGDSDGSYSSYVGGICGKSSNDGSKIISCFANTTPTVRGTSDGNAAGGITGENEFVTASTKGTVQGCTWYYNSGATPGGIEACYSGWTSGDNNASYSDNEGLAARVDAMNQNATNYDYQWQANGSTLKLVKKQ